MRALILAGGRATRLYPLTLTTPKAMTPLLGRPFLEHVLAWLRRGGVDHVTLLLGHLPDPIRDHFGDGSAYGVWLDYAVEREPLGSGGALKQVEAELTERFFALNADSYTDLDLRAMAEAHRAAGAEISIALARVDDPSAFGVVERDTGGRIRRFVEKPPREEAPSDLVNAGTWLFELSALRRVAAGRPSMVERELFPELAAEAGLYGYVPPADAYWIDAGTPDRYLQLHRDLLTGRVSPALPVRQREGWPGLLVGEPDGVAPVVERGGTLAGPVVLGSGARIGAGARVDGPAVIGAGGVLDTGATVTDSILWGGCRLEAGARVAGSVVAGHCTVGAGATIENCIAGEGAHILPNAVVRSRTVAPGERVE